MKCETEYPSNFVSYDDNNIEHVLAGPDYGQPWGEGWDVETSSEFIISEKYKFNCFKLEFS